LVEATAFGALTIINRFEEYGVKIDEVINCGGIAEKNAFVMQLYADVTGRPMKISRSAQTPALGSAIAAAVVAGAHKDFASAQAAMTGLKEVVYQPDAAAHAIYAELYAVYRTLHDAFGTQGWQGNLAAVMKRLMDIRDRGTECLMLEDLKQAVCKANLDLVTEGLVIQTFGNVSGIDRASGLVVIKPSGVSYDGMTPEHMVVVSLETGQCGRGRAEAVLRYGDASGALSRLQGRRRHRPHPQPLRHRLGAGPPRHPGAGHHPCRLLARRSALHAADDLGRDFLRLRSQHRRGDRRDLRGARSAAQAGGIGGKPRPFAWGRDAADAVHNAVILEYLARLASETLRINPAIGSMQSVLLDKHFLRKHGPKAYYGQK
jgi:hypothetical protein